MKLLSIIIPSYNMEAFLPKCLDSLIIKDESLFNKLEVLVVNDGSKDRTSEIAHEYTEKYPNVFKVIDKPNGHYGSCINAALPQATGEYVKILDADDSVDSKGLSNLLERLDSFSPDSCVDVVFTDYIRVNLDGATVKLLDFSFPKCDFFDLSILSEVEVASVWMHAITYRRSMILEMGYRQTEGIPFTDQEWVYYPMSRVRKAYYLPVVVYQYLVGRDGQTIEEGYYLRNFQIIRQLALEQIKSFTKISQGATSGGYHFVQERTFVRSMVVYRYHLLNAPQILKAETADLLEFDNVLKAVLPKCYVRCGQVRLFRTLPFGFVNAWRDKVSGKPLMYWLLMDILLPLAKGKV